MFSFEEIRVFMASCYFIVGCRILQPILSFFFEPWTLKTSESGSLKLKSFDILADIKPFYESRQRGKKSFLLKFSGMKNLTYLDREDVTLYTVSEEEFVFVRTKAGVDLYNVDQYPFLYEIQHSAAVEVFTAPHSAVLRYLRRKPARDGRNISYLHNHGRCGSTLIANMMYKTKQFIVQSEPNSIMGLALMINRKDHVISRRSVQYLDLIRATFLLSCPDPNKKYFIKAFPCFTLSLLPLLKQALPGIRELFNHRALLPTIVSFKKLFDHNFTKVGTEGICLLPVNYRNLWKKIRTDHEEGEKAGAFQILAQVHAFLQETQDRDDIKTFSYECLMEKKEEFTTRLLKEVGIGEEYLHEALSALEKHSQTKSETFQMLTSISRGIDSSVSHGCMEWISTFAYEELGIDIDSKTGHYSTLI